MPTENIYIDGLPVTVLPELTFLPAENELTENESTRRLKAVKRSLCVSFPFKGDSLFGDLVRRMRNKEKRKTVRTNWNRSLLYTGGIKNEHHWRSIRSRKEMRRWQRRKEGRW